MELQVQMWSRPRPPSLLNDWIFLYVMGGPGRILSEGVRLESGFWETIQGGCGPQNSVIVSESVLPLDSASGGRRATAGQRCPALSPSTIQTPPLGLGRCLVNMRRCVISAFGAVSEGPGVRGALRDRTLLMAGSQEVEMWGPDGA